MTRGGGAVIERPLHIGVDGRELIGQPTGVGRYLQKVLEHWIGTPAWPHRLTVFLHGDPPAALATAPTIEWHVDRSAHGGTVWEQTRLPRALASARADVLFAVGYTAPVRTPCPFVVVIHDVSFFSHPEWFHWREGLRRRWLTKQAALRAATILTVSNFSADEIGHALGISRDRIRLAPPGAPPASTAVPAAAEPLVLYAGSLLNRRHVPELIAAFTDVVSAVPEARLVLAGANRTTPPFDPRETAAALGISHAVEWRDYVDGTALSALYRRARAFAFLSEYEGFAMTPMEAIAEGVPALLLDTPVAREIYGDAAVRVPLEKPAIAGALVRLLTDDAFRESVLERREALFARFSWPRTADTVQQALEEAAARP